jgi:AraC-like DNA-binding protein
MLSLWSTTRIAAPQRAEFWRGAVCEAFLAMTPRIARAADFRAQLHHRPLERLALNRVLAPAHGVARTPADLARDPRGRIFVNLNLGGAARLLQFGREHVARPGELLLIDGAEPYELTQDGPVDLLSLAVPHAALDPRTLAALRDRVARPLPARAAAGLLAAQMQALARWPGELGPAEAAAVAEHGLALIEALVEPSADTPAPARAASRGALLRRLMAIVAARHAEPGLTPAQVAHEAGVSLRSLHAAFADAGGSFGAALMACRLARAHALLASPLPLAELARRCGFRSAAHFSRRFRDRYGHAPSALRAGRDG